jgi:hypothetical protein
MHETIEGEVIVIDLTTGSYYSLRDASAAIWQEVEKGTDEAGIAIALEHRYEAANDEIRDAARRLLDELVAEGLVERVSSETDVEPRASSPPTANERRPFQAPVLEKHSDMQDLILLDPVHEVGPQGWPHAAKPDVV